VAGIGFSFASIYAISIALCFPFLESDKNMYLFFFFYRKNNGNPYTPQEVCPGYGIAPKRVLTYCSITFFFLKCFCNTSGT
jgi:hypothetical protein